MKFTKKLKRAVCLGTAFLAAAPSLWAQLTHVNIAPTNNPPGTVGTYTPGAAGAGTLTADTSAGNGFFPPSVNEANVGDAGDVMTFIYETVAGDFDRRVKLTSITADAGSIWSRGALQVRTGTNAASTSLQVFAGNPLAATTGGAAAFVGRALDGMGYTWFSRTYPGVSNAVPNQWLRLRRVGDYFSAYVGTNGTNWTLIGQRYQELPASLVVGPYAASSVAGDVATVVFANYGATPLNDSVKPVLLSAGTLDKKVVGVRFSEAVSSTTAKTIANYSVTQGVGAGAVTINSIQTGISGDAVYLTVTGLTNNNFTVRVIGGIADPAGNTILPNTSVAARALGWNHDDQGYIQDTTNRPQPGDDPGTVGRAVMISSDENPEIEIVGGGSNSWNPGDFIHYLWRTTPLSGNFDVTVAVSRNDRPANAAGWGNSGIMLRAAVEVAGENPDPTVKTNLNATKVQMVLNTTYTEGSGTANLGGPGRGSIPLWRTATFGGYGNGNAGFGAYGNVIGGIKGYYADLNGIDASGTVDPQSAPDSARYLRIVRVGTLYTFFASWNRATWALVHGPVSLPDLPDQLLLGFSTMNDTGGSNPPFSAYANNGHELNPLDPYNPAVAGGRVQNEANYSVQRIKVFPNGVTDPLPVALARVDIRPPDLGEGAPVLPGTLTVTGTTSFDMTGGGIAPFRNTASAETLGDVLNFAYEQITGDFDKQVNLTSLTNELYNFDGTPIDTNSFAYTMPFPTDAWARAGLMVRKDTNSYNACLKLVAGNPAGANEVRVMGRGIDGQNYTMFSRSYSGVSNAIPNQYLRIKRVGNSFTFYVGKDGVVWNKIGQSYQDGMPSTVQLGAYCAAGLDPFGNAANPDSLSSRAFAKFTSYKNVELGDVAGPRLVSAGTIDKKTIGVKFNEPVSSVSGTATNNYSLSQGTVTAAKLGIDGDSVYLTVSGLSADTFTVAVTNVTDTTGNKVAGTSAVNGKASTWTSADIGLIQNPSPRTPTPGDDPYKIGQAVATSSDEAPEVEIIGGGSNAWNPGDYLHWIYTPTPLSGDFDVAAKVSRYDRPNNTAGWANSGVMLRTAVYNAGEAFTVEGTKVPMVANTTYLENSGPGRSSIPLFRGTAHAGYGNGAPAAWTTPINGIKGYFGDLRGTNSVGSADPESSATTARWLRINRTGSTYTFMDSYDGINWRTTDTKTSGDIPITDPLLFGFSTMNDSGAGAPPFSGYGGNGHSINAGDPLNPVNAGGNVQNESNYSVQRVRLYSNSVAPGLVRVSRSGGVITITYAGTLVEAPNVTGPWTTVIPQPGSPGQITPTGARKFYTVLP